MTAKYLKLPALTLAKDKLILSLIFSGGYYILLKVLNTGFVRKNSINTIIKTAVIF